MSLIQTYDATKHLRDSRASVPDDFPFERFEGVSPAVLKGYQELWVPIHMRMWLMDRLPEASQRRVFENKTKAILHRVGDQVDNQRALAESALSAGDLELAENHEALLLGYTRGYLDISNIHKYSVTAELGKLAANPFGP